MPPLLIQGELIPPILSHCFISQSVYLWLGLKFSHHAPGWLQQLQIYWNAPCGWWKATVPRPPCASFPNPCSTRLPPLALSTPPRTQKLEDWCCGQQDPPWYLAKICSCTHFGNSQCGSELPGSSPISDSWTPSLPWALLFTSVKWAWKSTCRALSKVAGSVDTQNLDFNS